MASRRRGEHGEPIATALPVKLLEIMTPAERRHGVFVLALMVVLALVESAGVASIMPYLAVLGDPGMIDRNGFLSWLYLRGGFSSVDRFLLALGAGAFVAVILAGLFRIGTAHVIHRFVQMRRHTLGTRLLQVYLRQPYEFFLDRNTTDLARSILSEVDILSTKVIHPVMRMISYGAILIVLVGILIAVEPGFAAVAGLTVATMYIAVYVSVRGILGRIGLKRVSSNRDRYRTAGEALGGIKDLKVLGREEIYIGRFARPSLLLAKHQSLAATISVAPRYAVEAAGIGGLIAFSLFLMTTRENLGEVLPLLGLFAFASYRLLPAAQRVYAGASDLRFGAAALDAVHEDLVERAVPNAPRDESIEPLLLEDGIRFRGVGFRYPGAEGPALKGLDLVIEACTCVGFVGPTGAGKTTTVDLILGLLRPDEGEITIDGRPLDAARLRQWQKAIGYVPQSIYLVDGSVSENISFGVDTRQIDRAAVERAARIAQIHEFITQELPSGYETQVGERGVRMSGGQRQRIGIARALYHDPSLLVLDEATSALDMPTERAVMEAIAGLSEQKTIVVIAHRLSTVKPCDRIFVLEGGQIEGAGTFEDLERSNELFRRLSTVV